MVTCRLGEQSVLEADVWEPFPFALVTKVLYMNRISTLSIVLFNNAFTQFLTGLFPKEQGIFLSPCLALN